MALPSSQPVTNTEIGTVKKKRRSVNFSLAEEEVILTKMEQNRQLMKGKHQDTNHNMRRNKLWKEITNDVNAISHVHRDVEHVKRKWEGMQYQTKKRQVLELQEKWKTGGGTPQVIPKKPLEDRIAAYMGETSMKGICGGFDTLAGNPIMEEEVIDKNTDVNEESNYGLLAENVEIHLVDSVDLGDEQEYDEDEHVLESSMNLSFLTQNQQPMTSTPLEKRKKQKAIQYNDQDFNVNGSTTTTTTTPSTSAAATGNNAASAAEEHSRSTDVIDVEDSTTTRKAKQWMAVQQFAVFEIEKKRLALDEERLKIEGKKLQLTEEIAAVQQKTLEIVQEKSKTEEERLKIAEKNLKFTEEIAATQQKTLEIVQKKSQDDERKLEMLERKLAIAERKLVIAEEHFNKNNKNLTPIKSNRQASLARAGLLVETQLPG